MDVMIKEIRSRDPFTETALLLAVTANERKTHDGIDEGGKRAAAQAAQVLQHCGDQIKKISVIGHSLGGLYARYVIGHLLDTQVISKPDENGKLVAKYELVNFVLMASPQIGSREHSKLFGSFLVDLVSTTFFGRTGKQLMLMKTEDDTPPLIQQMNSPDSPFMVCLQRFKNLLCFSNLFYDTSVHFYTSTMLNVKPDVAAVKKYTIEGTSEKVMDLSGWLMEEHKDFGGSAGEEKEDEKEVDVGNLHIAGDGYDEVVREIFKGINSVKWNRFGVIDRPIFSHVDIVVKISGLHDYGIPVVQHMASRLDS
eukprot:TRINITY_DN24303_c0_g1_i1.p1 TRINITY_DN24303_c0_g1~~TRINITY_DN24303_c0_g1_i1.p1  ORF type:complete len:359 (-),score=88.62 TRINITY_DN24303_c0_g1_i1:64-993(-)